MTVQLLAAFLLAVVATGRLTRLVVHDSYPPVQAVRLWWVTWQARRDAYDPQRMHEPDGWRHGWGTLLTCPFCFAPYAAAVILGVGIWSGVWSPGWSWASVWWVGAVWASIAYLGAILVAYDEPAE